MTTFRHLLLCSVAVSALLASSCAAPGTGAPDRTERGEEGASASVWSPDVPAVATEAWRLPAWASSRPPFPYLPGEDRQRSRSVGGVTHGWLVNAVRIPRPHPNLAILPRQADRDLDYTTQEMVDLVVAAAQHVEQAHPGSVLYLGNFSADGGGDIPHSVSHNSGRDGDLAFYVTDREGEPIEPPDLLPLDDDGKFTGADGVEYRFDVARNWALIEGLIENGDDHIQYVFVSDALRKMLLDRAREVDAKRSTVRQAGLVLTQPGGALPHNDHFHIRLYCSAEDVRSGCSNRGRKIRGYDSHVGERRDVATTARKLLDADDPSVRLAAVRRLGLLEERAAAGAIADRLADDDPRVRGAAVRVLGAMNREEDAVIARLDRESDPQVRAEMVWALGDYQTNSATEALTGLLQDSAPVNLAESYEIDLRVLVADVLAFAEDPRPVPALIDLTAEDDADLQDRAHLALTMLTNHDPSMEASDRAGSGAEADARSNRQDSLHQKWRSWWKAHRKQPRDRWLLSGFASRGFDVQALSLRYVWELTKPVLEDDHLSYNAQRVLMRLSKRTPASLDWPKSDANFYWRRWFERRCKRLGCPPVPEGLTTLD